MIHIDIPTNVMVAAALKGGAEHEFFSAIKDATVKEDRDKFPGSIFLFSGNRLIMEIRNLKQIWCSYSLLWSKIEPYFGGAYSDVQQFIKSMVEEHFRLKDVTPTYGNVFPKSLVEEHFTLRDVTPIGAMPFRGQEVEEHFRLKDVTPLNCLFAGEIPVEEHFKLKDVTPISPSNEYDPPVEEHFKLKDVTPIPGPIPRRYGVEEHFKLKDVTPDKD